MLEFFRRYQRYFFYVITVVIIASFSFFGTYNGLSDGSFREQIAFKAIDGEDITRHELDEMAVFIGTDAEDKLLFGGAWGPNFLNDGVIKKNFLETGLATVLVEEFPDEVRSDLSARLEKEKRYSLYANPQARFVGVETAWKYFFPAMLEQFNRLRSTANSTSSDSIQARAALFMMEKQLPAPLLRQVLRYQEKQYSWLTPDPNLDYTDLSLFGYHTTEDWFGPRFVRLVSEFIINASILAEQKGYEVTKAEALADLMRNSEASFQQNKQSPQLGVTSSQEYFEEQLRRLGMDQSKAAKIWRQVLLFRRFFQDMGRSAFVDPFAFAQLEAFASASVEGELFRLPKELRLGSYRALQKLEIYLDAVAKRSEDDKSKLKLPQSFLSPSEVSQKYPELIQKRYLLEVAQVNKKALESLVGVKESWNWETGNQGWAKLKKEFPELGIKKGSTPEERYDALDSLDDKVRARIDAFARAAIVDEHPEWIETRLTEAPTTYMSIGMHEKGGKPPFTGLENNLTMMKLLDEAPLKSQDIASATPSAMKAAEQLKNFSADHNTYYRISVIDRSVRSEILTFGEAEQEEVLDKLLDSQLEAYYMKIREAHPDDFRVNDTTWKPFVDVKDLVADYYFDKVLKAIRGAYAAANDQTSQPLIADFAATWRLYPYVREMKEKLQKDPSKMEELTKESASEAFEETALAARQNLADQWKVERIDYQTTRGKVDSFFDKNDLFSLAEGDWTKINTPANGDIHFFHLEHKEEVNDNKAVATSVMRTQNMLSYDAQQRLMMHLLSEIKNANAISLDYLNQAIEMNPTFDVVSQES